MFSDTGLGLRIGNVKLSFESQELMLCRGTCLRIYRNSLVLTLDWRIVISLNQIPQPRDDACIPIGSGECGMKEVQHVHKLRPCNSYREAAHVRGTASQNFLGVYNQQTQKLQKFG